MTDAKTPGTPYLIHAFEHKAYAVPADRPLSIGRETTCDVIVNEVAVSRHHAEVRQEGESFVLYPVGSTTTVMNGLPVVAPQPLQEQSTFMVGSMKFIFTKERLPVAMKIATPMLRPTSVDDRRPTLTFPGQPNAPEIQQPSGGLAGMIPLIVIAVAAVIGGAAYWAYSLR
ncbi:MAG TPA: FHA domain-containing protein [Gemmatimonadaceae bacterium]|jgi:pSer/pThr/pTyr-binding forkhead associated (FHA) protein